MKIRTHTQPEGSALVVTLLTALVIGITLASYLTLVSNQNTAVMRSLAWNSTVPVLESGVEEALTQIHYNGITNLSANGWSYALGGVYRKERSLGEGRWYTVVIQPTDPPVIEAIGYVPVPLTPSSQLGMILGGLISPSQSSIYVNRQVRVNTRGLPRWDKAMAADGQIDLQGNNIQTDSFDSCNPAYSTNGRYDPAKARDNGDVATNSGLVNTVNVGNADIKGHVSTGPGGSVSIGPQGTVGSKAWVEGGNRGIQTGYVSDDMNVEFPPVDVPYTAGYLTPTGATVNGVNYNYVMGGNGTKYKLSGFSGKVLVTGNVSLYVTSSFSFTGQDYIEIAPGASLKVYVGAATASLGGNGVVNNTGNAINFQYYGLPSNTSLSMNGNAAFTGVIYAPQAALSLGGGGNNTYDFVGACVTATAGMNGHFNFHFDECLRKGPVIQYVVTAWNEI
jgi:hypothetical protein